MARIKAAVNAHKKRRKIMKLAKGYWGAKSMHTSDVSSVSVISVVCGLPVSTRLPA